MGWESNDYDFMGDTSFGDSADYGLDPTGMDSWNTGSQFANNPNAGGTAYDLGYDNSWNMPTDYSQMGSGYDIPFTYSGGDQGGMSAWGNNPTQTMSLQDVGGAQGGIEQTLGKLFSDPKLMSAGLGKLLASVEERKSNKGRANDLRSLMASPTMDPFGSQRGQYQQLMSQTYQDPSSNPLIKQQLDQNVERMQRTAAARGVRFNPEAYREQLTKQNTDSTLAVMKDLQTPAGAGLAPSSSTLGTLGTQAAQYGNTGNAPLYSAAANLLTGSSSQSQGQPVNNAQSEAWLRAAFQQNPNLINELLQQRVQ